MLALLDISIDTFVSHITLPLEVIIVIIIIQKCSQFEYYGLLFITSVWI